MANYHPVITCSNRLISKPPLSIMALLLIILSCGCATSFTDNRRLNMEPFFNYDKDTGEEYTQFDAIGPLFTFKSKPKKKEYGLRPFFYVRKKEEGLFKEVEYLYPLGKYRVTEKERVSRFIPLFSSHKDLSEESKKPSDFGFFPVFWGKDEENKNYWGVFPIYGRLSHRFGKDRIRFFLWPLYSDSKEGGSRTQNILWPIFSRTTGGGKSGWRIWPLYGQEEKEDEYSKYYALWPIFFFQKTDLDTDNPRTFTAALPLFVSSHSPDKESRSFLWPFSTIPSTEQKTIRDGICPGPSSIMGKGKGWKTSGFSPYTDTRKKMIQKAASFYGPYTLIEKTFLRTTRKEHIDFSS